MLTEFQLAIRDGREAFDQLRSLQQRLERSLEVDRRLNAATNQVLTSSKALLCRLAQSPEVSGRPT